MDNMSEVLAGELIIKLVQTKINLHYIHRVTIKEIDTFNVM